MAERSPFPKKETEVCKLSCESMQAGIRAAALPSIKSNDTGRPTIIMSPPSSNLSSSSLLPLIGHCSSSCLPITPDHQAHSSSSILIPNPNPNSIGSPNPNPSFRSTLLFSSSHPALDYHSANYTNSEKVSTCRFKKAEQSPNYNSSACIASPVMPRYGTCSTSNSGLTERSPRISSAQKFKDYHLQTKEDDQLHEVGLISREDPMISAGGFGLLAAHAYSPWIFEGITSCADEYQEVNEVGSIAGLARASRNICEEYSTMGYPEQPTMLEVDDRDRSFAGDAAAAPVSPSSLGEGAAAHSSPSSSASELQDASTATVDDTTSTLTPGAPDERGGDPSKDAVPTDNTPPLKKQRRKGQKRVREARVALLTKSEVEHLEDGYRWRKYGQKAVKNSPHPRSYYRCTNSKCFVKKRVERCSEDPSLVVTTYEGQHTHHSPALLRGSMMHHDPNILNSSPTAASFLPWPSSLINPNIYLSSSLAHTDQLNTPPFSSSNMQLSSFPLTSSPALHYLGHGSVQRAQLQAQLDQGAYGHGVISLSHNNFTPAFGAAHHHEQQSSSLLHVITPMAASATFQTPLVDKGLLHDMLPHSSTGNASPPSSSMS